MTLRKSLLLGLVAFAVALIVVLPARWIGSALPSEVTCAAWAGSVWRGQCLDLRVNQGTRVAMRLSEVHWKLKPLSLLRLAVVAEFSSQWPEGRASGTIEAAAGGTLRMRDTAVESVVDRRFVGALPKGWAGRASIKNLEFDWQAGRIDRLGGEIRVTELLDSRGNPVGGYTLMMPSSTTSPHVGTLRDSGGPLEVEAQVQLTADRSWSLDGRMRARDVGNARFNRQLDMFASPDAQGWRRLSAAGTFD